MSGNLPANDILDRVAAWVERRDREDWSAGDQADLDAWLAESPAHLVAFLRADNTWMRADRLSALRTEHRDARDPEARPRWLTAGFKSVALFAAIGIFGAAAWSYGMRPSEEVYSTPVGGHTVLSLADGSKVELNTDTVVRISKIGARRAVKLDRGEAFFEIRHDAAHPFVVLAANHRVTDLGTKFVVRARENRLEVTLIEGRAQIETATSGQRTDSAVLTKGDVAVATANSLSVQRRSDASVSRSLGWQRGVVVFDNMTLADAAIEFNRYNTHKLIIADSEAAGLTVVGTFHTNDVKGFAEVAQDILHLHVETRGNRTVLSH